MGIMDHTYHIRFLREEHFPGIMEVGAAVHGDNYLSEKELQSILKKSIKDDINCSFTLSINEGDGQERVIGFRLTYAPGMWMDTYKHQMRPDLWGFDPEKVAYLKSNTIEKNFRGLGFGKLLLNRSIAACERQGAEAAVTHIWMYSPDDMAYKYFVRTGAKALTIYDGYWHQDFEDFGYDCAVCGEDCQCPATEMLLDFSMYRKRGN